MPAPLDRAIRNEIVQRHEQGESLLSISEELKLSYSTVKKIWQHWRDTGKLEPNYELAKQKGTRRFAQIYPAVIALKQAHRRWGAQLILLEVKQVGEAGRYPSVRTVQRWFQQAEVKRSADVKQTRDKVVKRGQQVHQVWAVDAKERMKLADGSWASWLIISDEASGAILSTAIFPPQVLDEN